jgi:hypothetical protein
LETTKGCFTTRKRCKKRDTQIPVQNEKTNSRKRLLSKTRKTKGRSLHQEESVLKAVLDDIQAEKLRFWMPVCEENIFPPRALGKKILKREISSIPLKTTNEFPDLLHVKTKEEKETTPNEARNRT